jgi:hypothetical protein
MLLPILSRRSCKVRSNSARFGSGLFRYLAQSPAQIGLGGCQTGGGRGQGVHALVIGAPAHGAAKADMQTAPK